MTVTLDDQIACVRRELELRRRVYPPLVAKGRMKPEEAEREIARMHAVLGTLLVIEAVSRGSSQ